MCVCVCCWYPYRCRSPKEFFGERDFNALTKFVIAEEWHAPLLGLHPLFIVRAGLSNTKQLMETVTPETVMKYMLFKRECIYLKLDKATRETGKIVKSYTVNDLNFVSLSGMQDKRFSKALGGRLRSVSLPPINESTKYSPACWCSAGASAMSEKMYPQMLEAAVLINVPRIFSAIFALFKNFLPKRTLEKIKVGSASALSYPRRYHARARQKRCYISTAC